MQWVHSTIFAVAAAVTPTGSDIPVIETQTDTEKIDISKTHTETNTEKIFNTDTVYI